MRSVFNSYEVVLEVAEALLQTLGLALPFHKNTLLAARRNGSGVAKWG